MMTHRATFTCDCWVSGGAWCCWPALFAAFGLFLSPGLSEGQQAPQAVLSGEAAIYQAARRSVFRIEAGLGHGSGFLLDPAGLVATNDHVVGTAGRDVSVYVDSATRVEAVVLYRDAEADVAVLQIPQVCIGCAPLRLDASSRLEPGDRVVALGFPLNQQLTMVSGIVGAVREGAIILDMNINHGNSGGPVLTPDGAVVGIATFRDIDEGGGGPGLGGAVAAARLGPILEQARRVVSKPLPDKRLPVIPTTTFPIAVLKATADTVDPELYSSLGAFQAGPFNVSVTTPLSRLVAALGRDRAVARDRREREEKAGVPAAERYTDPGQLRDWAEFVGFPATPVVAVKIEPKIDETGGSVLRRSLIGGAATLKFMGDVRTVRLFRNGQTVEALAGGHAPVRIAVENVFLTMKDVADFGYYVYPPEVFRPDGPQKAPDITLEIEDLKNPSRTSRQTIPPPVVARIWNDFEAYYRSRTHTEFVRYMLTKNCALNTGAAAMGGVAGTAPSGGTGQCEYVLAPLAK